MGPARLAVCSSLLVVALAAWLFPGVLPKSYRSAVLIAMTAAETWPSVLLPGPENTPHPCKPDVDRRSGSSCTHVSCAALQAFWGRPCKQACPCTLPQMADRLYRAVLGMLKTGLRPKDIMTKAAFTNALTMVMATGGSTNAVLHFLAIARAVGVELSLDDFQVQLASTADQHCSMPSHKWCSTAQRSAIMSCSSPGAACAFFLKECRLTSKVVCCRRSAIGYLCWPT